MWGLCHIFYGEAKLLFLSPSWERGHRSVVSLTCQECCCSCFLSSLCPLAAFALCSSVQRYTEWLWADKEKTSSRTKHKVCSHANLINNGQQMKRNGEKKKNIFLLEGEGTYCTTAKRECERWSLSEFTSLSIKQNSGYFTVIARFSQAVEWQTSLKNKQRNLLMSRFLPSQILSFFFFLSISVQHLKFSLLLLSLQRIQTHVEMISPFLR